jgi:hypothetical protein
MPLGKPARRFLKMPSLTLNRVYRGVRRSKGVALRRRQSLKVFSVVIVRFRRDGELRASQ